MDNISHQATLLYNNTTTSSNTVTTQILSLYSLSATVTSLLKDYTPGKHITYISRIENTGSSAIYNLKVTDNLGNGVTRYIPKSVKGFLNGTPIHIENQYSKNSVTFTVNHVLNPNDNVIIIFETSTPAKNLESIQTTQTISGNGGTTSGTVVNVIPKPTATVALANYATLNITKSVSSNSIYDGDELNYIFEITNSGNNIATHVTFSDSFPDGYKIKSITLSNDNSSTPMTFNPATYVSTNILTIPNLTIPVGTSKLIVSGIYHD